MFNMIIRNGNYLAIRRVLTCSKTFLKQPVVALSRHAQQHHHNHGDIPSRYNFVRDHLEKLAIEEQASDQHTLAYSWADVAGNEVKFTYSEIVEQSKILANGLLNQGFERGDRIFLLLPRVPEWWILCLACIRTGIVPIPATLQLSEKDITYRLDAAQPKAVVTIPEVQHKVDEAFKGTNFRCQKIVCPQLTSKVSVFPGWVNYSDITKNASSKHSCIDNLTDDSMMIYFTSGTTGMPKMVELTHGYALGHRFSTAPFLNSKKGENVWVLADPGWVATLYGSLFPPWYNHSTVFQFYVPPSPPVWGQVFEILKKYPVNHFITPPTVYRMLLNEKLPKREELAHLKECKTGGEPLNSETLYTWREKFGHEIREIYGQTETPGIIGCMPGMKIKPGSFGKALGFDIRIIDDDFKELPNGEEGHIAIKYGKHRPFIFKQYIGNPQATHKAFRHGYYLTGDRGRRDDEDYLWFSSRSDDIIISSGYRIGPFEVESAVLEHPAVLESAAVSSPDRERGEIVKSFVVLKPNYKNLDKEKLTTEIQDIVKKVTAPYKYPRKIEYVDELPKTISNKIKRAELRAKEWANHKAEFGLKT